MKTKYEVGQEVITNVRVTETVSSIEINSHGTIYHLLSGKVYSEMVLASIENKPTQPIAPQEDKAKFKVGDKAKIVKEIGGHCFSIGEIVRVRSVTDSGKVTSAEYLDKHNYWYIVNDELEPYAEPEKEPEPVYYSGKVVCVDTCGSNHFTQYKGYEIKDGIVIDNDGDKYNSNSPQKTLYDFNQSYVPQFIPYLGE